MEVEAFLAKQGMERQSLRQNCHSMFLQDSLKHPTVRDFLNSQMGAEGFTAEHIINFLHNGSSRSREKGMVDFDWRNIFSAVDQVLRLLSQYLEVNLALPLQEIAAEGILKPVSTGISGSRQES